MKKGMCLAACLLASSSFAATLGSYDAIHNNVVAGKSMRIAIDFAQCTAKGKALVQPMRLALYTPNEIAVFSDHIAASLTHFTINNPAFPGEPVYEFARYNITPDNTVNLSIQVLAAANYAPMTEKSEVLCTLGTAAKVYSN